MNKSILIIGIPLDLGQAHRGVNMCPSAIRYAGLADRLRKLGYQVTDCGNLDIPVRETLIETGEENVLPSMIEANEKIFIASKKAIHDGFLPIFLEGDHSISIGTISGVVNHGACGVIPENESVDPPHVVKLRKGLKNVRLESKTLSQTNQGFTDFDL